MGPVEPRPYCYRCDKPAGMCLCSMLQRLDNRVGVHIVQHPQERHHALGTVRLLRLGLSRVDVHVVHPRGRSAACTPIDLPTGAGLLYPSKDALDLQTVPATERPTQLVVIDGTWTQTHRIARDNPWLSRLPRYRLPPGRGSRYRIRAEPRRECLSTVEAVVRALRLLEPTLDTQLLIEAFDAMIDAQIAAGGRGASRYRRRRLRQQSNAVPQALHRSPESIVVAYAEAAPDKAAWRARREALRLTAVTLGGQRVFDAMITPRTPPDTHLTSLMGLDDRALESSRPVGEVTEAFEAFCAASRDRGVALVSWGPWTHRWLEDLVPDVEHVMLKGVWANLCRRPVPAVDAVLAQLGLAPTALPVTGRAGRRLGQAHAMARHIVEVAATTLPVVIERADSEVLLDLRARVLGEDREYPTARMLRDKASTTRHWVARSGGAVVGCVSVMAVRGFMLRGLAVAPERRRQGIGGRLLQRVADEVGSPMWCNARAEVVGFYEAHGWVAQGPVFELRHHGAHQRMTTGARR